MLRLASPQKPCFCASSSSRPRHPFMCAPPPPPVAAPDRRSYKPDDASESLCSRHPRRRIALALGEISPNPKPSALHFTLPSWLTMTALTCRRRSRPPPRLTSRSVLLQNSCLHVCPQHFRRASRYRLLKQAEMLFCSTLAYMTCKQ